MQAQEYECSEHYDCDYPPIPFDAERHGTFAAKFFFDEVVVVEVFVGKIDSIGFGCVRPTRLFVGAALGTSFGIARDACAAIGASFGRHVRKFEARNPKFE
jgi:hypothetical protein